MDQHDLHARTWRRSWARRAASSKCFAHKGPSMATVHRLRARFRIPADLRLPPPKKLPCAARQAGRRVGPGKRPRLLLVRQRGQHFGGVARRVVVELESWMLIRCRNWPRSPVGTVMVPALNRTASGMSSVTAIFSTDSSDGAVSPRSILLIMATESLAASANSSWLKPRSCGNADIGSEGLGSGSW